METPDPAEERSLPPPAAEAPAPPGAFGMARPATVALSRSYSLVAEAWLGEKESELESVAVNAADAPG